MRLEGAESCISAAALVERVEQRVNRVLFTSTAEAELFIDGRVQPADLNGWLVTVEMSDRSGRVLGARSLLFRGAECGVIDETVALFIAVRLYSGTGFDDPMPFTVGGEWPFDEDPDPSASDFPAWQPEATSPPAAPSLDDPPASASEGSNTRIASRSRPILDVSAVGSLGQLPGLGTGASVHLTVFPDFAWPLQLGFTTLFERARKAELVSGQAAFAAQLGSAQLCPFTPTPWFSVCAGAELGRLAVTATGFRESSSESQVMADVLASSVLRLPLPGSVSLHARLGLAAALVRPPYQYETPHGKQQLFRLSQVAGQAELGVGIDL